MAEDVIQNVDAGRQPTSILANGNPVDSVANFVYLGSLQSGWIIG